jgi:hypothetical protein
MQYRESEFRYDAVNEEYEADFVRQPSDGRQYSRKRSVRATRRRTSKSSAAHPGCGMGARRKHRWTW